VSQPEPPASPPVQRRVLAARLRRLRLDSGLKLEQVAKASLISTAMISRMETGARPAKPRDVRELARVYGLAAPDTEPLLRLAVEAQGRAWWQEYPLSATESTYVGLETAARWVHAVDLAQMHGLVQTEGYARALLLGLGAEEFGDPARVAGIVDSRTVRQHRLTGPDPLELELLLGEAALTTQVGGAAVMHDQLTRLLELSELPNVTLRVLPFSAGVTRVHLGAFTVLGFRVTGFSRAVYVEGLTGELVLDRPEAVNVHEAALASALTRAHDPAATRRLIEKVRNGWGTG
jgi:transcriptional regulator with XRE-family HTH domain